MNFSRFFLVLFLSLIFIGCSVMTQYTGYVITTRGDTLRCVIDYNSDIGFGRYRTDTSKEFIGITKENIKGFCLNYKGTTDDSLTLRLITSPYTGRPEYVTMLEEGKIKLYSETINNYHITSDWEFSPDGNSRFVNKSEFDSYSGLYAEKENSGLVVLESSSNVLKPFRLGKKAREEAFRQFIADNSEVNQKYLADNKSNDATEMWKIIHLYNTGKPLIFKPAPPPKNDDDTSAYYLPGGN